MTMPNSNQTDIFSMFNLVDEHAEQKKREEETKRKLAEEERQRKADELRKKVQESTGAKAKVGESEEKKKVEPEKIDINEETVIRYYGESFEITSYFTPEELAEGLLIKKKDGETERKPLEPEMLRKRMEKDFPELVKEHTEIIFLKNKNIVVPTMKAKKKGNCSEEALSSDNASPVFPKIPFSILRDFIAVARLYGEIELEVHADIYFQPQNGTFFMDIPKQVVHRLWTEVTEDSADIVARVEDAVKVLEIHSHHTMAPIPSMQDNRSERVPGRTYAIVGHIERLFPAIYVRQFLSEEEGHATVLAETVFAYPFEELPSFDINAIEVEV